MIRVAEDVQRQQQKLQRKQLVIDNKNFNFQEQLRTNQQDMASQTVAAESAAWQRKGKNKRVVSMKRDVSPMKEKTQVLISKHLNQKVVL